MILFQVQDIQYQYFIEINKMLSVGMSPGLNMDLKNSYSNSDLSQSSVLRFVFLY